MFISLKNREMLISSEHVSTEMLISHTCMGSKMLYVLSINVDVTFTNYDVTTKQSKQRAYTVHVHV